MKQELSEKDKILFEKRLEKISNKDTQKVKDSIPHELEKIRHLARRDSRNSEKLLKLVDNSQLLYTILSDEEFPISKPNRKWIIFALEYLISPFDLIPDGIGGIGYLDDAMVINWVMGMISEDIDRYNAFIEARIASEETGYLKHLLIGDFKKDLILVPGNFTSFSLQSKYYDDFLKQIKTSYYDFNIYKLNWNIFDWKELSETTKSIDHKVELRVTHDTERFSIEWADAKKHAKFFGMALYNDLQKLKQENPGNELHIIGHGLGARVITKMLDFSDKKFIDTISFLGGMVVSKNKIVKNTSKLKHINNYYSFNDYITKYIFDNFEKNHEPIGLTPLCDGSVKKIIDFNSTKSINRHSDYLTKVNEILTPAFNA